MRAAQLTITDADGRSFTLDLEGMQAEVGKREASPAHAQDERTVEGSFIIPLAQVYIPKERAPGPHPYRWPAPRRARV